MGLTAFLDGLTFTAPYSIDDARVVHAAVHRLVPGAVVCVHSPLGTQVVVEIRVSAAVKVVRRYDVV